MKIKTKWTPIEDRSRWDLHADIIFEKEKLYFYLASIERNETLGLEPKKIYIVTDIFGEYHPDAGNYFGYTFSKLKDAKEWVEKNMIKALREIVKQLKGLGK